MYGGVKIKLHVLLTTVPSHTSWYDYRNTFWWRVYIINLIILRFVHFVNERGCLGCYVVQSDRYWPMFQGSFLPPLPGRIVLMMEAIISTETSVNIYQIRCNIPENNIFHTLRRGNSKSHMLLLPIERFKILLSSLFSIHTLCYSFKSQDQVFQSYKNTHKIIV